MRAVLRIPRLTRMYHEKIKRENMDEFECLDKIYDEHFVKMTEDWSPKQFKELPIAERNLISRSLIASSDLNGPSDFSKSIQFSYNIGVPNAGRKSPYSLDHEMRVKRLQS